MSLNGFTVLEAVVEFILQLPTTYYDYQQKSETAVFEMSQHSISQVTLVSLDLTKGYGPDLGQHTQNTVHFAVLPFQFDSTLVYDLSSIISFLLIIL